MLLLEAHALVSPDWPLRNKALSVSRSAWVAVDQVPRVRRGRCGHLAAQASFRRGRSELTLSRLAAL